MTSLPTLAETARAMVAPGKGILAVDESNPTCTKRFEALNIDSTPDSRRDYRELMFRTPGLGEFVSGAILYDETIRQKAADGRPLVDVMNEAGIMPGIKVDTGAKPLALFGGETVTEGLDGLRDRLAEYREIGARFTKWRAVLNIDNEKPTAACVLANAHALARYAALVQEAGLVPIVEPEVLMNGAHDIDRCYAVTDVVLTRIFEQLQIMNVDLEGIVLKPNMVVPGMDCNQKATTEQIAELTLKTLKKRVPESVPGIAFLSGGMSGEESCRHLDAMNRMSSLPWELTFSFGRALQYPGLPTWAGKAENVSAAQAALLHRCRMSSEARSGSYEASKDVAAA